MDLELAVRLAVKDKAKYKAEMRDAAAAARRFERDAGGRFVKGGGGGLPPGARMGADGRLRDASGRFVGGGGGGSGGAGGRDNPGRRMQDLGSDFQAAGAKIVVAGAATAYGLKRLIQPVYEYEKAIVDTIAVTGDAANNDANAMKLRKLSESFVSLGANATDTARAMEFLALAGYGTQQQMQAMPNVLFAAKAGSEDVIKTAGYLSDVATGFGFGADKFQRVSDVMTYINNETSTTLSATAEAMKEIGPYAQQAGLDFENMAAGIGVLANAGFRGRQAGTAMRNMLLSFTKMSDPARAELKALGLEQQDFIEMINRGDLQGAVLKLDEAVQAKGLGAGEKFRVMNTIFQRFTSAKEMALALNAVRDGKWDELTKGAKGSRGSAEAVAKRKLNSDAGRMDIARARYEQLQVKIGQKILPALLPVGEAIVETLEGVANWVDRHQDLAAGIAKWMAIAAAGSTVLGPSVMVLGTFARGIGFFTSMVTKATPATAALAQAVAGADGGLGGAAASSTGKVSTLNKVLGSAGLVASAAAAGVAVGTLADQWLGLSDKLSGVGSGTDDSVDAPWWERMFSGGVSNFREDYEGSGGKLASKRGAAILNDEENSRRFEIEESIKEKEAEAAAIREKYTGSGEFSDESRAAWARAKQLTSEAKALKGEKDALFTKAHNRTLSENANVEKYRERFVARYAELAEMRKEVDAQFNEGYGAKGKERQRLLAQAERSKEKLETEEMLTARAASKIGIGLDGDKAFENRGRAVRERFGIDLNVHVKNDGTVDVKAKSAADKLAPDSPSLFSSM